MKFTSFQMMRYDPETGLRTPTITEAQSADNQIDGIIAELIHDKNWTSDEALHEMTLMRSDLSTLLQARPKLPKVHHCHLSAVSYLKLKFVLGRLVQN